MRSLLWGIMVVAVLGVAMLLYALWPTHTRVIANALPGADAAAIERGRYLAVAADCTACHTARGGQAFAGGLPIASPIGVIYSTNITPDRNHGIGAFSLNDFDRAIRHGIARSGVSLYPAMPYPSYAWLSDADLSDLYAYFMHAVAPSASPPHAGGIAWPLSIRWPLAVWRKWFAPPADATRFEPSRYANAPLARGAYLVQGAGHCGSCHTPRALTLQEKALNDASPDYLAGGPVVDGWVAVNLRGSRAAGLGNWSAADIVASLRTARNAGQAVIGAPMREVVVHSTQYLSDADLSAIAAYLKSLPAPAAERGVPAPQAVPVTLAVGQERSRAAELYLDNCAACHRSAGEGSRQVFPAIAGNSSVAAPDPSSLIRLMLEGSTLPGVAAAPSALGMPGFGARLSNAEIANLLTFIRSAWGNRAGAVSATEVGRVRALLAQAAPIPLQPKRPVM